MDVNPSGVPQSREPFAKMTRDQRAYAAWLAIRAGYPINRSTWGAVTATGQVVVEVPRFGATFGIPFGTADVVLNLIEDRYGAAQRKQAEAAVG